MLRRLRFLFSCGQRPRRSLLRPGRPIAVEALEARDVPALVSFDALSVDPSWYDSSTLLVRVQPGVTDVAALGIPGAVSATPLALIPDLWEVQLAPGASVTDAYASTQ